MQSPTSADAIAAAGIPVVEANDEKNSRRMRIVALIAVVVLAAAAWGLRWWFVGRYIQSTDDAYLRADSVIVAPKISGYVAEVFVADNESVTAGQPLVRLDSRQYDAILEQASAAIAARKADIARGEAELKQQQATIAQARAQLEGAKVAQAHAEEQLKRYEPLVTTGAETEERLAELRNARSQAIATVDADAAALEAAQRQPATTQAQIEQARAQLAAAEASKREAELDVQDAVVRSTLAGRVGDRTVRVGQFAQPGTRLMTIVPVQDVYLVANFKETQIGRMRVGQSAAISVDALPGQELRGTVESFSPGTGSQFALLPPENATGNFTKIVQRVPVRIHLEQTPELRKVLLPGLSVTVHVDTRTQGTSEQRVARTGAGG